MAVNLSPVAGAAAQFFDNSGNVLTGGKLYTYSAGTTTPAVTYTTSSGVTAHPNPIILNAAGRVPDSGEIWLTDGVSYKFVLKDQNDVLIATYDNLVGINSNFVNFTGEEETQTATQGQTVFTLTTIQYQPGTNNLLVFVNGSKQVPVTNFVETSSTVVTFVDGLNVGDVVDFCTATPLNSNITTAASVTFTGFKGQEGTVQDLANDDGSDWVGFIAEGTGAVAISAQDKMRQIVSVRDFGAVGDGTTDDTVAIQNALDSGALYITGDNLNYVVTTINPKSNQTIVDMRLLRKATATQVSMEPVVKISGDGLTVTNVTMQNVIVNGNRQNLADIYTGNGEDGGMHGFKISDGANNIKLLNCAANYCGSAGLAIHSETTGAAAVYPIKNIYLENFIAAYNREHGMFGDSFDGLHINGINSSYNGLTIATGYSDTNGNTAFKNGGIPFGSGFDLECYVGYPRSYFKNVYASDVVCIGSSTSCMIYAPPVVDAVAEIPAENIFLKNVYLQKGVNSGTTAAFTLYANNHVGAKYGITNVHLSGYLDGYLTSNNASGVVFTDGFINVPDGVTVKALINNGKNISVVAPSNKSDIQVETFGALSIVKDTGAGALTIGISQYVKSNGKHALLMPFSVSGGTIAGGNMSWTVTLPTSFTSIIPNINAYNATSAKSVIASVQIVSANVIRIYMTPTDDNIIGELDLDVLF